MSKTVNLFDDMTFKKILINPSNRKHLEYLIETFLELPRFSLKDKVIVKSGPKKNHIYCDFDQDKLLMYTYTKQESTILHFYYVPITNPEGKWVEYKKINGTFDDFKTNYYKKEENGITATYYFTQKTLDKLDNSTILNRWIKFIWARDDEERLAAAHNDEYLMELYHWLKKEKH